MAKTLHLAIFLLIQIIVAMKKVLLQPVLLFDYRAKLWFAFLAQPLNESDGRFLI